MATETTTDRMEKVFSALGKLLKEGAFTRYEIDFMVTFLEKALEMTRKLKARAAKS